MTFERDVFIDGTRVCDAKGVQDLAISGTYLWVAGAEKITIWIKAGESYKQHQQIDM